MELTIRNGLFEKLLTTFGLFLLCELTITGLIVNHTQHAGFEDGNDGGSIVVSLSSTPGAEAAAFGETISKDNPEATNQQQAQTTPEITQPVEKVERNDLIPDFPKETEVVEKDYVSEPQTETIVPAPKEAPEIPQDTIKTTIPESKTPPEPAPTQTEVAETVIDQEPKAEPTPITAKVQKPKPKPKPPVYKQPEPKIEPRQTQQKQKVKEKPAPQKTSTRQPTEQADTGSHKEAVEATNSGLTSDNQRSSGQKGVTSTKSTNTGSSNQQSPNSGAGQKATGDYWKAVQIRLARNKRYPRKAKRRQMQGVTLVEITLLASGKLKSYQILESSGFPLLDQAATKMVGKSAPFPQFPASITKPQMTRQIPVHFNLKN